MTSAEAPLIRCKNITLGYGRDIVLENVSLEIPRGVFLPFIGPNGAGKTTLLRAILGLIEPIRGVIHTPFKKAPAGYVPQFKAIDPLFPLTVREIMAMGFYPELGWWKKPDREQEREMDAVLEELNMREHAHKNYRDLSGGTKQKTLLARALVSKSEVFILDEPTSELDEPSEKEVFEHLKNFVARQNKTVLMAHHGLTQLLASAAAKVCRVEHGRVEIIPAERLKKEG